jgi:hypothetical protein
MRYHQHGLAPIPPIQLVAMYLDILFPVTKFRPCPCPCYSTHRYFAICSCESGLAPFAANSALDVFISDALPPRKATEYACYTRLVLSFFPGLLKKQIANLAPAMTNNSLQSTSRLEFFAIDYMDSCVPRKLP